VLATLQLDGVEIVRVPLLNKDSLEMTDEDRQLILGAVRLAGAAEAHPVKAHPAKAHTARAMDTSAGDRCQGVVILHGTDTLSNTGEVLSAALAGEIRTPVVLTGAMRPFEMKPSDALQSLTEALFAVGLLPPGVYAVAHGRALAFPGVTKDRKRGTFVKEG